MESSYQKIALDGLGSNGCVQHTENCLKSGGELAKVILVQLYAEKQKNHDFTEAEESTSKKMCDKFWCVYKGVNTQPFTTSGEAELCVFCIVEPNHCNAWHFFSSISKRHLFRHEEPFDTMYYPCKTVSGFWQHKVRVSHSNFWFKCGHVKNKLKVFIVLIIPNPDHSA